VRLIVIAIERWGRVRVPLAVAAQSGSIATDRIESVYACWMNMNIVRWRKKGDVEAPTANFALRYIYISVPTIKPGL
jgi:hypothetical protein